MTRPPTPATPGDAEDKRHTFRDDVLAGLARSPKCIPAKHIYDARGSQLFEQICKLDEYYLTRTERAIFDEHLADIAEAIGPNATIIEPGAGSGEKAALLLSRIEAPEAYVPIEISSTALDAAAKRIAQAVPGVVIQPICADFTKDAPGTINGGTRRVVFFPGSTIGNLDAPDRERLWQTFAWLVLHGSRSTTQAHAMEEGKVLIGFDLIKDKHILIAAYDDAQGVSAAFNFNLLLRINRELAGDFDVNRFVRCVTWNANIDAIEKSLRSTSDQIVTAAGERFTFNRDEHLHIERSYKFTLERMDAEAGASGFRRVAHWMDERKWFCVGLYEVAQASRL